MFELHSWSDPADAHIGAFVIIAPKPLGGKILYFFKTLEEILIQPIIAHRPVVPFDIAVLLRLARLDIPQVNAFSLGPALQPGADVLRAVVTADLFGLASSFDYLFKRSFHAFSRK